MSKLVMPEVEITDKSAASIRNIIDNFRFIGRSIGFRCFAAIKREDNNYEPVFQAHSCRSYIGEALFHIKATKFFPKTSPYNNPNSAPQQFTHKFNYLEGDTHIGLVNSVEAISSFVLNFKRLNKIEEDFNIPLSTYTIMENYPNMVIVTGSGMWKDSCWKIQLYTYILKTLFCNEDSLPEQEYAKLVNKNYKQLFGNIKMKPEEEVFDVEFYSRDTFFRHTMTGFVSICQGYNEAMAKVLGIKVKPSLSNSY